MLVFSDDGNDAMAALCFPRMASGTTRYPTADTVGYHLVSPDFPPGQPSAANHVGSTTIRSPPREWLTTCGLSTLRVWARRDTAGNTLPRIRPFLLSSTKGELPLLTYALSKLCTLYRVHALSKLRPLYSRFPLSTVILPSNDLQIPANVRNFFP